jgi:4-hydroxy 2-oxovalerate aldolase
VLAATFDRLAIPTGVDVQGVLAAADDVVKPFLHRLPFADRAARTRSCCASARPATSAARKT